MVRIPPDNFFFFNAPKKIIEDEELLAFHRSLAIDSRQYQSQNATHLGRLNAALKRPKLVFHVYKNLPIRADNLSYIKVLHAIVRSSPHQRIAQGLFPDVYETCVVIYVVEYIFRC
ncbi:hypothetical protein RF11_01273 [Thelohanellus kitauei]|uniref:Uncharacterized protein n=1 Tax=Thelohanellus kitauei TaxID=669202 RepID=A0A0C2IZ82_THEKT|nr:hypothetical protein RF11_01273 [Thelohanellus kitauei]